MVPLTVAISSPLCEYGIDIKRFTFTEWESMSLDPLQLLWTVYNLFGRMSIHRRERLTATNRKIV